MNSDPLTVTEFTTLVKSELENQWPTAYLVGEVSGITQASSGHCYFTLKDSGASISCVMWRSTVSRMGAAPKHGEQVEVTGALKIYPPRGTYQLDIRKWQGVGQGKLEVRFQKLKEKLHKEGIFDPENKKELPFLPQRIVLITSSTGAARHDMEKSIRDRFPVADIVFIGCPVQGVEAAPLLVKAIEHAPKIKGVDVVVCGRGGGSLEDLWSFNEEIVVRAIASCPIPIVSAVGHEVDVTLADFAADVRALTPTGVGALIVPDWNSLWKKIDDESDRLKIGLRQNLQAASWQIKSIRQSMGWQKPRDLLRENIQKLDESEQSFQRSIQQRLSDAQMNFKFLVKQLDTLSPLKVLSRGFSVATFDDQTLVKAQKAKKGDPIHLQVLDGKINAIVDGVIHG